MSSSFKNDARSLAKRGTKWHFFNNDWFTKILLQKVYYNTLFFIHNNHITICKLDGRVVSALGVLSRKLSTGLNGQS
jgi:hypothetical protein